jgi:glutamyl-tRNA synthetase
MPIGRYAPSPTGDLHVGNLRTGMLAWLFAHADGAELRLRIDDLDPATARVEHEARQLADLAAIGVGFDGPALRQSERTEEYRSAIAALASEERTYPCYCSRREIREAASAPHVHLPDGAYPGTCRDLGSQERARRAEARPAAIRIRAEEAELTFVDRVHGTTTTVVDDFVIQRNDGVPAYNLASVVDDAAQEVDEVVRGDDLLDGTARQILLRSLLRLPAVQHAHVPLMVNADGQRLAKRDGAVTLHDLRELGHEPIDVRMALAASVGLPAEAARSGLTDLLPHFDPDQLRIGPTVWTGCR